MLENVTERAFILYCGFAAEETNKHGLGTRLQIATAVGMLVRTKSIYRRLVLLLWITLDFFVFLSSQQCSLLLCHGMWSLSLSTICMINNKVYHNFLICCPCHGRPNDVDYKLPHECQLEPMNHANNIIGTGNRQHRNAKRTVQNTKSCRNTWECKPKNKM